MPFTVQNAVQLGSKGHAARKAYRDQAKGPTMLVQAIQLQKTLHNAGISVGQDIGNVEDRELRARIGSALASIAKGWDAMSARILILKGRPGPGTMSPAERRAQREKRQPAAQAAPRPAPKPAPDCPNKP
jgi:hypothetical protein